MIFLEAGATYGKTLFMGLEPHQRSKVREELLHLLPSLTRGALNTFFSSPMASHAKKEEMLKAYLGQNVEPFLIRFLILLLQKDRWGDLPEVVQNFSKRVQEEEGILKATLTTSIPLDPENRHKLLGRLTDTFNKNLVLKEIVDPQLKGGAVLKVGNSIWDGSVKGQLKQLKERLLNTKLKVPS